MASTAPKVVVLEPPLIIRVRVRVRTRIAAGVGLHTDPTAQFSSIDSVSFVTASSQQQHSVIIKQN